MQTFRPGLLEAQVRRKLERAKVRGSLEPIIALFSWHDGSNVNPSFTREEATPFPQSRYLFLELDAMCGHLHEFVDTAVNYPNVRQVVGRYFPLFWDGSSTWVAVDLTSPKGRVVVVNLRAARPVAPAYDSFQAFLEDAIKAVEGDKCLSKLPKVEAS